MKNKYIDKLNELDNAYKGQIIQILNSCRIAMSKADDVYLPDKVNKYKLEMIDKAIGKINEIKQDYIRQATSQLELEKAALQQPKPDNRSTTEKLLDAINLSNTIQLNTMQLKTKTQDELIELGREQEDSILVDCIKSELQNRLNTIPEEKAADRQELRTLIKSMKPYTELDKLEVAEKQVQDYQKYYDEFMPGVELGEKLNIGNPAPFGFRTPDEVIYDMRQQLTECEGYSPAKGLFSARKAIMQYAQLKKLPNVSIEDIYTGNGVSELINLSMSALLDNGDEILIPSPDYPLWTACATLAGGKAVHYICDEQAEWYPDMDDIRKKITSRTKAIVIINPNNPTGALYPREVLQQIVDIAREHHLIIFSDEIYDRLVMDGAEHISIASMAPDLFCVTFSGLSKSHMIAGFRIGWMILSGNKAVAKDYIEGIKMLSNMRLCSNVPAQSIVQTALGGHQSVESYIVPGGRIYEQREFIYNALTDIPGITAVKPKAAFYMFPKIDTKKFNIVNDEKFALDLLKEKKILLVHGGGFNWHQPDHFRVVYLPRIEVLKEAAGKIRDFLEYYQQEI